jgi:NADP-dependent 3-hydroxy acid dehydrogenase YdfG
MNSEFAGKAVIVTGATSGIGQATALRFARSGASIAAVGRNGSALDSVKQEIEEAGGTAVTIPADLTVAAEAARIVSLTKETYGSVDVLVNAAGHISSGTIESTSLGAWDAMLEISLRAVFQLMQAALPSLLASRGNIVNVSSVTGLRSFP